jgi:hypothetical protein
LRQHGVDFWASPLICDPYSAAPGRGIDPALGFASCRVVGRSAAHAIGLDPAHITSLREDSGPQIVDPRSPNPLMGFSSNPTAY